MGRLDLIDHFNANGGLAGAGLFDVRWAFTLTTEAGT